MNTRLTRHLVPPSLAAALLVLGGCASAPDVRVNYDNSVNFAQYKTFGFASPLGIDRNGYQRIVAQTLKASTQREMEARGMRLDSNSPQLLVNFNAKLSETMRALPDSATLPEMGMGPGPGPGIGLGYYGYRAGAYSTYPNYSNDATITEGTLNIDVVDAASKQLVWEGVVTNSISQKAMDNPQPAIDAAVTTAFAKFPVPPKAP